MQQSERAVTIKYAKWNLEHIAQDNDITIVSQGDNVYIQLRSGHALQLSDSEINHQACTYLRSEIDKINSVN